MNISHEHPNISLENSIDNVGLQCGTKKEAAKTDRWNGVKTSQFVWRWSITIQYFGTKYKVVYAWLI